MDQRRDATVGGTGDTSNMRSMSAPTPEQMRALADLPVTDHLRQVVEIQAALRVAADQLDAVARWNYRDGYHLADRELETNNCEDCAAECGAYHEHRGGHHD